MRVSLEQSEGSSTIRLEGAIDIALAGELKALLLEALGCGKVLRISMGEATDLDVTAMQLLWAARREAEASGAGFAFEGQVQERVATALDGSGLMIFVPTDQAD